MNHEYVELPVKELIKYIGKLIKLQTILITV